MYGTFKGKALTRLSGSQLMCQVVNVFIMTIIAAKYGMRLADGR